jgi:Fe(3+) dicitrate transport protein
MKFLAILTCFFAASTLLAQDASVSGTIVNEATKQAVAFANISVDDVHGTFSSEEGTFTVNGLPPGDYVLRVSAIGYAPYTSEAFNLKAGQQMDLGKITLQESAISIPEIVITEQQKVWDTKYSGTNYVIPSKSLERFQPIGSEELIRTVPGVNIAGDLGISNRPNISIRGSDPRRSNKILLLEDGSPISPAPYLAPGAYYNPPADRLDGIQVIKGPDVLVYGGNTIFGVVNYITKRPVNEPAVNLRIAGGQRGFFTASGSYGGTWGKSGAELVGIYKQFDGYLDNTDLHMVNLAGKWYSELSDRQSLYMKIVYQQEYVNNSLSGMTPFTFENDPTKHPFDADEFTSHRYGLDLIYNYKVNDGLVLQTKVYGSDFYRDWWKQNSVVVRASEVKEYVGDDIYGTYYSYLDNLTPGDEDYVRVGKVVNGIESNSNSRWQYLVYGLHEKATVKWGSGHNLEAMLKLHGETYHDIVIQGDSSKWARSGRTTVDAFYTVLASSAYLRNDFRMGRLSVIPIVRFEQIALTKNDLLQNAANPANSGPDFGIVRNNFGQWTPGLSIIFRDLPLGSGSWEIFSGAYQAFSSPTTAISFNEVMGGQVMASVDIANLKPEQSFNQELGARWVSGDKIINGQLSVFNMFIDNFYSPARAQAFETLGSVRISGMEMAASFNVSQLFDMPNSRLNIAGAFTYMNSAITEGTLTDKDLFSNVVHNAATKAELVDKINNDRAAFDVYLDGALYEDATITVDQFDQITSLAIRYGDGFVTDYEVPYVSPVIYNVSCTYEYKKWMLNGIVNHVGAQYTEFFNFNAESSDGSIGQLPAYTTLDANLAYAIGDKGTVKNMRVFVSGKNLTNQIYRASRLNRATGGLFPAGFLQVNAGISLTL